MKLCKSIIVLCKSAISFDTFLSYTDCKDRGCLSKADDCNPVTVCRAPVQEDENTTERCSDGIDNDWNGYIDCDDRNCVPAEDVGDVTACRSATKVAEDTEELCSDGIDNDWDGSIDCKDVGCKKAKPCLVENTEDLCSDHIDNDLDGQTDCDDYN